MGLYVRFVKIVLTTSSKHIKFIFLLRIKLNYQFLIIMIQNEVIVEFSNIIYTTHCFQELNGSIVYYNKANRYKLYGSIKNTSIEITEFKHDCKEFM